MRKYIVIFSILFLLFGCSKKRSEENPEKNEVFGFVKDRKTYAPISQAAVLISVTEDRSSFYECLTDENGNYYKSEVRFGILEIAVEAQGYKKISAFTHHQGSTMRNFDLDTTDTPDTSDVSKTLR